MRRAELLISGRVATLAGDEGLGWVEALAIGEGLVLAAGQLHEVQALVGPDTRRLELGDGYVCLPAITDAHLHLVDAALAGHELDLEPLADLDAAIGVIASLHAERASAGDAEGWLLGHGWSFDRWGAWPTIEALDSAAPGRPVALWAHDHHTRWVSRAALSLARIDEKTPDPPGGVIGRDAQGQLSGLLFEHATTLIDRPIPEPTEADMEAALIAYCGNLAGYGVTGCHDPGDLVVGAGLGRGMRLYRRLAGEGRLPMRVHASVRVPQLDAAIQAGMRSGQGVDPSVAGDAIASRRAARFHVGWLKQFADGSLGSRTAALLEPYSTRTGDPPLPGGPSGMLISTEDELRHHGERAAKAGIVSQIHAIGDRAVRVCLDVLAKSSRGGLPLMPRIEHVQLIAPDDVHRFALHGIAASVQPGHLLEDWEAVHRSWRSRTGHSFPWASLVDAGGVLAMGTDAPVSPADPWPGIAVAAVRTAPTWSRETTDSFDRAQALGLARALRAACVGPAVIAGETDAGGRLTRGCRADLMLVDAAALQEPLRPGGPLATVRPALTVLDGLEVHRSAAFER